MYPMVYYYNEINTKLDNSLRKLATDKDILEMVKYVAKYKVIDLYVDHSVFKKPKNVDNTLLIVMNNESNNLDDVVDSDVDDVLEDVSDDDSLQGSLTKVGRMTQSVCESSRNERLNIENVGAAEYGLGTWQDYGRDDQSVPAVNLVTKPGSSKRSVVVATKSDGHREYVLWSEPTSVDDVRGHFMAGKEVDSLCTMMAGLWNGSASTHYGATYGVVLVDDDGAAILWMSLDLIFMEVSREAIDESFSGAYVNEVFEDEKDIDHEESDNGIDFDNEGV
ncbi:hypothetical protein Tco_1113482 [Tanacetum coccineum]|uniref:Uncharacterized protein n=1 Tax=Tanacetum coccineum TaxID=301880 RepID=A0ABQ5ISF4_9ASTR